MAATTNWSAPPSKAASISKTEVWPKGGGIMSKQLQKQQGVALIFAMIAIIVILGALGIIMTQVHAARTQTSHAVDAIAAEEAAQAGIDMAVKMLWEDYIQSSGNTTRNWASFRFYLDNELDIPINEDLNFNGQQDADETGNGNGEFETYPTDYDPRGWPLPGVPFALEDPEREKTIATIDSVHVARYDDLSRANLTVTATATVNGKSKTAVQVLNIGGRTLPHTKFAVLANNISCILCHAEILSLGLERNTDPALYGTFDRIKVASLESMLVRHNEAASNVAGTVYTRGRVYKQNGREFSASDFESADFRGYRFSDENGKITQEDDGDMQNVPLSNASTTGDGDLEQFANLYMDYPLDPDAQTDGPVPNSFPAPYPDENENRVVDDAEFSAVVNSANGSVSFEFGEEDETGSIVAGVAYGVPGGDVYTGSELPADSNEARDQLSANGTYTGNLILRGTHDDPIIINKTVAVDGDLVIAGPVKGQGQLLVRGNAYVVGDVTYADDPGEFGQYTQDGEIRENAFALVAGGSIMMGDYLTVRGVNHSAKNNYKYPTWSQYSIHTREEHKSNNVTIDGRTETLEWGYFDEWAVDSGQEMPQLKDQPDGRPGNQFSFTTSELKLFNMMELEKAIDDASYVPRFYGLRESQPNNIYIWDANDEHSVRYDENGVKLLSDYLIEEDLPLEILDRAVFQYCSPDGNWMSEDTLRQIWFNDEMTRPSSGRPFQFDGLLYSNNSIWCIVRSKTRHKSYTNGQMRIRGGVIAADLGVFAPGNGNNVGFEMLYDPRVERFLEIRDTSVVSFARSAFYFARAGHGETG
jgi:hypothetical protein